MIRIIKILIKPTITNSSMGSNHPEQVLKIAFFDLMTIDADGKVTFLKEPKDETCYEVANCIEQQFGIINTKYQKYIENVERENLVLKIENEKMQTEISQLHDEIEKIKVNHFQSIQVHHTDYVPCNDSHTVCRKRAHVADDHYNHEDYKTKIQK